MRSTFRGCLALLLTAFVGLPASASAIELGYCDPSEEECECSPSAAEGYDGCAVGGISEVTSTDDPLALRDALNLEVIGFNGETETVEIAYDASSFSSSVLALNERRGHWESVEELDQYTNLLLYGTLEPDFPPAEMCRAGQVEIIFHQLGAIARVDPDLGNWTPYQTQNIVYAAISDEEGQVFVDGELIWDFDVIDNTCQTAEDGDFRGTQCSSVDRSPASGPLLLCGEDQPVAMRVFASTTIGDFGLQERQNRIVIVQGYPQLQFYWLWVTADTARVDGTYYDGSGQQIGNKILGDPVSDVYARTEGKSASGTCGEGEAIRGKWEITPVTRAGTAPFLCSGTSQ